MLFRDAFAASQKSPEMAGARVLTAEHYGWIRGRRTHPTSNMTNVVIKRCGGPKWTRNTPHSMNCCAELAIVIDFERHELEDKPDESFVDPTLCIGGVMLRASYMRRCLVAGLRNASAAAHLISKEVYRVEGSGLRRPGFHKRSEQIFRKRGTKILAGDLMCETVARRPGRRVSRIAKGPLWTRCLRITLVQTIARAR